MPLDVLPISPHMVSLYDDKAYGRREQDADCQVWRFGTAYPSGQVKGYASAEECYWCTFEHDSFRWVTLRGIADGR